MCHPRAVEYDLPKEHTFWLNFDRDVISCSDEMWVLTLPGWEESVGVANEIAFAREIDLPVVNKEPSRAA